MSTSGGQLEELILTLLGHIPHSDDAGHSLVGGGGSYDNISSIFGVV